MSALVIIGACIFAAWLIFCVGYLCGSLTAIAKDDQ